MNKAILAGTGAAAVGAFAWVCQRAATSTKRHMTKALPELERFRDWAGIWFSEEHYEPSEWMPQGGTGTGRSLVHLGPAGIPIEEYRSKGSPMGPYEGHQVLTFDRKEQTYRSFWFDSWEPRGMISRGHWAGDELVFTGESTTPDGKKTTFRMTYSHMTRHSRTLTAEESVEGGPLKTSFRIVYRKRPPLRLLAQRLGRKRPRRLEPAAVH